jgi:hypothetical protein
MSLPFPRLNDRATALTKSRAFQRNFPSSSNAERELTRSLRILRRSPPFRMS